MVATFEAQVADLKKNHEERVGSLQAELERAGQSASDADTARKAQEESIEQLRGDLENSVTRTSGSTMIVCEPRRHSCLP